MATTTIDHRPLTGDTSSPLRQIILHATPIGIEEHLVHGWDALERAREGDQTPETLASAEARAMEARALATALGASSRRRRLALEEIDELVEAIAKERADKTGTPFEEAVMAHVIGPLRAAFSGA